MGKPLTPKEAWDEAQIQCAKDLAKLYLNTEGNTDEAALKLVVDSWSSTMRWLNISVRRRKFNRKKFDHLTTDEKLKLIFPPPHPTLGLFANVVRFGAAVAQKVA